MAVPICWCASSSGSASAYSTDQKVARRPYERGANGGTDRSGGLRLPSIAYLAYSLTHSLARCAAAAAVVAVYPAWRGFGEPRRRGAQSGTPHAQNGGGGGEQRQQRPHDWNCRRRVPTNVGNTELNRANSERRRRQPSNYDDDDDDDRTRANYGSMKWTTE